MNNPEIKFCGIRSLDDLKIVSSSLAEYIGFIFADSKRRVEPEMVKEWIEKVDVSTKKIVAVFVNPSDDEIKNVLQNIPVDVIQFHGTETLIEINKVRNSFKGSIWKALHHHEKTIDEMKAYENSVDGFLIDSRSKGQWGGTGVSFDWQAVPQYINFSNEQNKLCFIAGGVNESNIIELLALNPMGIDLSSGIEMDNKKSEEKIQQIERRLLHHANISR